MRLLVAKRDSDGRWQRVRIFRTSKDGTTGFDFGQKHAGTMVALAAKRGALFLANEPAAVDVDFEFAATECYRVSRI